VCVSGHACRVTDKGFAVEIVRYAVLICFRQERVITANFHTQLLHTESLSNDNGQVGGTPSFKKGVFDATS